MDQMLNRRIAAVKAADAINATETPASGRERKNRPCYPVQRVPEK